LDAANGIATTTPVKYDFFNNYPGTGLFGLGLTGLMTNKVTDYYDLYIDQNLVAGGTAGALTVVNVSPGDALGTLNNQENAFQFGVKSTGTPFTVQGRLLGPFFNNQTPQNFQSQGIYLGNGDQDNYLKIALTANGGTGGLEVVYESSGVAAATQFALPGGIPPSTLDFYFSVNPGTGMVQPQYAVGTGAVTNLGSPIKVDGALLAALQSGKAFAVGVISTSRGATPFTATWDYLYVKDATVSPPTGAPVANAGPDQAITLPTSSTTLAGAGTAASGATIAGYSWSQVGTTPAVASFSSKTVANPTVSGLTVAGVYTFALVVTDNTGAVSPADQVTVTVNPAPATGGSALYRINAGGGAVTNSIGTFAADNYYTSAPSNLYSTTAGINGTTDDAIYQTERYSNSFGYAFPVSSGLQYKVVLHFAEIYFTSAGQRKFDVSIEGNKVLDNYDIFAKVGSLTAKTETFTVSVADDALNINFSSLAADGGADNAKISAIEVYSLGTSPPPTAAPVANAGPDQTLTLPTSSTTLAGAGTAASGATVTAYSWTQVGTTPAVASFSSKTVANPTVSGLTVAGVYTFALVVTDNTGKASAADQVSVMVNPAPGGQTAVYRLNAGGPALSTARGAFAADQYFSPAPGYTYATTAAIAGTPDPALYRTERSSPTNQGTFAYALPLANGTYTVVLHFAEIYWSSPGQRLFDVTLENVKVLDNYDIVRKAGALAATTETFTATVADGVLNLGFSALPADGGVDRPKLSAIEVLSNTTPPAAVAMAPSAVQEQPSAEGNAAAYPTPTPTGRVFVRLPETFDGTVRYALCSALGATLARGTLARPANGEALPLDFAPVMTASGVYFLRLEAPHARATLKLLKW
jgi:hypothetical protein